MEKDYIEELLMEVTELVRNTYSLIKLHSVKIHELELEVTKLKKKHGTRANK